MRQNDQSRFDQLMLENLPEEVSDVEMASFYLPLTLSASSLNLKIATPK
jgi:hypothetical protein